METNTNEKELIQEWISQMHMQNWKYKEPFLDRNTTQALRESCLILEQDLHVFITTVEILEEYITRKNYLNETINDPALAMVAAIFISSKYTGKRDFKIADIQGIFWKMTEGKCSFQDLRLQEIEILTTLKGHLPIQSVVEDLNTCVIKVENNYKLKATILPVCFDTLVMMYITKKEWFFELKELYVNNDAFEDFEELICSRFYLPVGILTYILKISGHPPNLNVESVLEDLASWSQMHINDLKIIISKIEEMFLRS